MRASHTQDVCRFYGLSVWFPDVIKHLQADEYASRVKIHNSERIEDFTFNFTLENQIHRNGVFLNDRWRWRCSQILGL